MSARSWCKRRAPRARRLPRLIHLKTVTPDGIEPSLSCLSRRRLRHWTTGSFLVVEVGVEPTKSPDSRSGRFACLRTRPFPHLDNCWWRVRELHPDNEAHEASRSSWLDPQVASPGIEPGDRPYESQFSANWLAGKGDEKRGTTDRVVLTSHFWLLASPVTRTGIEPANFRLKA